jgi:hypothetical protein
VPAGEISHSGGPHDDEKSTPAVWHATYGQTTEGTETRRREERRENMSETEQSENNIRIYMTKEELCTTRQAGR